MAERAHALAGIRALPKLGFGLLSLAFQMAFTVLAIVWHEPSNALPVIVVVAVAVVACWFCQPWMKERELRARTQSSAIGRFYLDALLGIWCLRAHGGAPALMQEQEALLVDWSDSQVGLQRLA